MLDPRDERVERLAMAPRQQEHRGAAQRRVPDPLDALDRHRREEADRDRVRDVDRVREATGEERPIDLLGLDAEASQEDALPARVRGLRLGEEARVERENVIDRSGATVYASRPFANRPSGDIQPTRRSSARMSTSPDPQMPSGSASPIVR